MRWPPLMAAVIAAGLGGGATPAGFPPASAQPPSPTAVPVPLVRVPFPADDGSLTPYTFSIGYPLVTLVYDTLMWRDAGGTPQPWLARSIAVSGDGLTATIPLVPGVRWQDGVALTAADVAFTFRYVAGHPHPRFGPEVAPIAGVETPDDTTVVIHLTHPVAGLADEPLADVPILPEHLWGSLPAGAVAPEGLPVGSGPYRMVAHRPGEGYRFEANPGYFRGPPGVGAIEVPIIPDVAGAVRALRGRRVDMIPVNPAGPPSGRPRGLGIRLLSGPSYAGTDLVLNTRRPPFNRPDLRRAVAMALDLGPLTRAVGDGVPADHGYLHPQSPWAAGETLQHADVAAARRALSTAGLPPLQVLAAAEDPVATTAARQVALALQRVGLEVDVRPLPRDDLATAMGAGGGRPDFDLAIGSHPAAVSDDPDELGRLFGSAPGSASLNRSGYADAAFDALAARAATATDPVARRGAVDQVLRLLATDVPVVPLLFATGIYAYHPAVYDGWVFVRGSGILDKRSFVELRRRAEPILRIAGPGGEPPPVLGWIALALLGAATAVAAVAALGRRR